MARIRTIKPALVDSKDVAKVSREARYFFTILLMFLDDKGKCEFMPKRLAGLLFPHDEDVDGKMVSAWTEECVAATLLEKYTVNGKDYLRSPTFWKHQVINRPTPSRCPNPDGTEDSLSKPETLTEGSLRAHGASKYGVNNWRLGIAYTRLIAAMMRHIVAFASGQDVDPESGELHMAHVMANASMLISMPKRFDDRYREVPDGTGAQL